MKPEESITPTFTISAQTLWPMAGFLKIPSKNTAIISPKYWPYTTME